MGNLLAINVKEKFNEVKGKFIKLIENGPHHIMLNDKEKVSGIYMIYLAGYDSDTVLPIYIGRSNNIVRRYKQHYKKLCILNRLDYDVLIDYHLKYHGALGKGRYRSFYEGEFGMIKIFKEMVEQGLSLENFKMILLEECSEDIEEKEMHYIEEYLAPYLGFNQIMSFTYFMAMKSNRLDTFERRNKYLDYCSKDAYYLPLFLEYGFSRYNFNKSYGYPSRLANQSGLEEKYEKCYKNVEILLNQYGIAEDDRNLVEIINNKNISKLVMITKEEEYNEKVSLFFMKYNAQLLKVRPDLDLEQLLKYLKYFFEEPTENSYFLRVELVDEIQLLRNIFLELSRVKKVYGAATEEYSKYTAEVIDFGLNQMIFPSDEYGRFPLQHNSSIKRILPSIKVGEVVIDYVCSENLRRMESLPAAVRISVKYYDRNQLVIEKNWIVDNELTKTIKDNPIYLEKYAYDRYVFRPERFSMVMATKSEDESLYESSYLLSANTEINTGINDVIIRKNQTHTMKEINKELSHIIEKHGKKKLIVTYFPSQNAFSTIFPCTFKRSKLPYRGNTHLREIILCDIFQNDISKISIPKNMTIRYLR